MFSKSQPGVYNSPDILIFLWKKTSVSLDSCSFLTGVAGDSHESCNLGNNPGHAVVTRADNGDIDKIIKILTTMSDKYGISQTNSTQFQLFNSTGYGGANLLFKDSTTKLMEVESDKRNYDDYLGKDYGENKVAMEACEEKSTTAAITVSTSSTVSPIIELVLLIALLGAAHRFL